MATILGGRINVPNAECALEWHSLLSLLNLSDSVHREIITNDWPTAEAVMDLVARDYGLPAQEAKKTIMLHDVAGSQAALAAMLKEIAPSLMREIIGCECKSRG